MGSRVDGLVAQVRAHRHTWRVVLGSVFVLEAAMLLWTGRHQWYFFDEWRLVVERVVPGADGPVEHFRQLFRPDGEHVIALPLAVFVLLTRAAGLGTFWPFVIANVVVRLATMWLADDLVRRLGGRRLARLAVVASIALFGAGYESLFGQSLIFAGFTLVFSLLAMREMLVVRRSEWVSGAVAATYLVGAIFSSSYGFPAVVGVALYFALTSRRIAAVVALVVPPVAFLAVRAMAGGSYAQQQPVALTRVPLYVDYVQYGLARLGEALTGLEGLGIASFVGLVAAALVWGRGREPLVFVGCTVVAVVAFFGQASLSRSVFGAEQAGASRYLFFCGVLTLVALGGAWGDRRVPRRIGAVVAVLLLVSLTANTGELVRGRTEFTSWMQESRVRVSLGMAIVDSGLAEFQIDPEFAPDLFGERLAAVTAWSGAEPVLADGARCLTRWTAELERDGRDMASLEPRQYAAMLVLLNEHSLGIGGDELTIGQLIDLASYGGTGSPVLDAFVDQYLSLLDESTAWPSVPSIERCAVG